MAVHVTLSCDVCGSKMTEAFRSRIKWSRESGRSGFADVCGACSDSLAEWFDSESIYSKPKDKRPKALKAIPRADLKS